jgi:hypothetical protein
MGVEEIEVVVGSIEIGGHHRQEIGAILAVVSSAHLNTRDFGHSVRFIGRLQRTV